MKKLLLLISVLLASPGYCQDNKTALPATKAAPAQVSGSSGAGAVTSAGSLAMHRRKKRKPAEVKHTAPQQEKIDSIKKAKTGTKK
jgi:hypothetical protein